MIDESKKGRGMSGEESEVEIHRGLIGVYFDRTTMTRIDGRAGELYYRGYSIHDLAGHASFEEIAYLLLMGSCRHAPTSIPSTAN